VDGGDDLLTNPLATGTESPGRRRTQLAGQCLNFLEQDQQRQQREDEQGQLLHKPAVRSVR
jgi:hypothetical protein